MAPRLVSIKSGTDLAYNNLIIVAPTYEKTIPARKNSGKTTLTVLGDKSLSGQEIDIGVNHVQELYPLRQSQGEICSLYARKRGACFLVVKVTDLDEDSMPVGKEKRLLIKCEGSLSDYKFATDLQSDPTVRRKLHNGM